MSDTDDALIPFEIAGRTLAVPLAGVLEVLGAREWIALPGAPPAIPGATAWRGRAIALIDLAPLLGGAPLHGSGARPRMLVVQLRDEVVALAVDRVHEACAGSHLVLHHAVSLPLPRHGDAQLGDRLVSVVDLDTWILAQRRSA